VIRDEDVRPAVVVTALFVIPPPATLSPPDVIVWPVADRPPAPIITPPAVTVNPPVTISVFGSAVILNIVEAASELSASAFMMTFTISSVVVPDGASVCARNTTP